MKKFEFQQMIEIQIPADDLTSLLSSVFICFLQLTLCFSICAHGMLHLVFLCICLVVKIAFSIMKLQPTVLKFNNRK